MTIATIPVQYSTEKVANRRHNKMEPVQLAKKNIGNEWMKIESNSTTDLYTRLIHEARYVPGNTSELVPLEKIPWIDKSLINESTAFHRKFLALVILSNTAALMFGFAIKSNTAVLLKTGKLYDPELSFQRYLSTVKRIGQFFTLPFNMEKAYEAFRTVRKMHALAASSHSQHTPKDVRVVQEPWKMELALAVRKDLEFLDTSSSPTHVLTWNPPVALSQFDMTITQLGFWGSIWLSPQLFGVKDRDREMRGVIHVWAIFGRLLGIQDEYNICLKPDPILYEKLFRNVVVASLKTMDETVITFQSTFMEAFGKRMPFITYKSMIVFGLQGLNGFKGDNLWKLMSWRDKCSLKFMNFVLWMMRSSVVFRILINILFGLWLQVQCWLNLSNVTWPSIQHLYHKMQ